MRAKVALAGKGVAYEAKEEDLFGGKSELLLKSNPIYQKVPVLFHNGKPLCESTVIVSYIDETWPSPLLPPCPYARAQARFWADYIDKKVFDAGYNINIWSSKGEAPEEAKREFIDILKQLEGELGEKDFYGGDAFGFVDILLIPLTSWFLGIEKLGKLKMEDECPKLSAWIKRCMQRSTVAKVVADSEKVCEFLLMFRKMQGID